MSKCSIDRGSKLYIAVGQAVNKLLVNDKKIDAVAAIRNLIKSYENKFDDKKLFTLFQFAADVALNYQILNKLYGEDMDDLQRIAFTSATQSAIKKYKVAQDSDLDVETTLMNELYNEIVGTKASVLQKEPQFTVESAKEEISSQLPTSNNLELRVLNKIQQAKIFTNSAIESGYAPNLSVLTNQEKVKYHKTGLVDLIQIGQHYYIINQETGRAVYSGFDTKDKKILSGFGQITVDDFESNQSGDIDEAFKDRVVNFLKSKSQNVYDLYEYLKTIDNGNGVRYFLDATNYDGFIIGTANPILTTKEDVLDSIEVDVIRNNNDNCVYLNENKSLIGYASKGNLFLDFNFHMSDSAYSLIQEELMNRFSKWKDDKALKTLYDFYGGDSHKFFIDIARRYGKDNSAFGYGKFFEQRGYDVFSANQRLKKEYEELFQSKIGPEFAEVEKMMMNVIVFTENNARVNKSTRDYFFKMHGINKPSDEVFSVFVDINGTLGSYDKMNISALKNESERLSVMLFETTDTSLKNMYSSLIKYVDTLIYEKRIDEVKNQKDSLIVDTHGKDTRDPNIVLETTFFSSTDNRSMKSTKDGENYNAREEMALAKHVNLINPNAETVLSTRPYVDSLYRTVDLPASYAEWQKRTDDVLHRMTECRPDGEGGFSFVYTDEKGNVTHYTGCRLSMVTYRNPVMVKYLHEVPGSKGFNKTFLIVRDKDGNPLEFDGKLFYQYVRNMSVLTSDGEVPADRVGTMLSDIIATHEDIKNEQQAKDLVFDQAVMFSRASQYLFENAEDELVLYFVKKSDGIVGFNGYTRTSNLVNPNIEFDTTGHPYIDVNGTHVFLQSDTLDRVLLDEDGNMNSYGKLCFNLMTSKLAGNTTTEEGRKLRRDDLINRQKILGRFFNTKSKVKLIFDNSERGFNVRVYSRYKMDEYENKPLVVNAYNEETNLPYQTLSEESDIEALFSANVLQNFYLRISDTKGLESRLLSTLNTQFGYELYGAPDVEYSEFVKRYSSIATTSVSKGVIRPACPYMTFGFTNASKEKIDPFKEENGEKKQTNGKARKKEIIDDIKPISLVNTKNEGVNTYTDKESVGAIDSIGDKIDPSTGLIDGKKVDVFAKSRIDQMFHAATTHPEEKFYIPSYDEYSEENAPNIPFDLKAQMKAAFAKKVEEENGAVPSNLFVDEMWIREGVLTRDKFRGTSITSSVVGLKMIQQYVSEYFILSRAGVTDLFTEKDGKISFTEFALDKITQWYKAIGMTDETSTNPFADFVHNLERTKSDAFVTDKTLYEAYKYAYLRIKERMNYYEGAAKQATGVEKNSLDELHKICSDVLGVYSVNGISDREHFMQAIRSNKTETTSFVQYHFQKYALYKIAEVEEVESGEERERREYEGWERAGNELSAQDRMSSDLHFMLSLIPSVSKKDGRWIANVDNNGLLNESDKNFVMRRIFTAIGDAKDNPQQMKEKLEENKDNVIIRTFLDLAGDDVTSSLWTDIFQVFSMERIELQILDIRMQNVFNSKKDTKDQKSKFQIRAYNSNFADATTITSNWINDFNGVNNEYVVSSGEGNKVFYNIDKILNSFDTIDEKEVIRFAEALGIKFENRGDALIAVREKFKTLGYAATGMKEVLQFLRSNKQKQVTLGTLNELGNKSYVFVKIMAEIEESTSNSFNDYSCRNANGDRVYELSLNNNLTLFTRHINRAKSIEDLTKNSSFEQVFDGNKNPFVQRSTLLKRVIGGKKLRVVNLSGVKLSGMEDKADVSSDFQKLGIDDMTFASILFATKGMFEVIRHADKKTSYSVMFEGGTFWFDKTDSAAKIQNELWDNYVKNYLLAEMKRIWIATHNKNTTKSDVTEARAEQFLYCEDLLDTATKEALLAYIKTKQSVDDFDKPFLEVMKDSNIDISRMKETTIRFFEDSIQETKDLLNKAMIDNGYNLDVIDPEFVDQYGNSRVDDMATWYVYSAFVNNMEVHPIFYGDLSNYDLSKEDPIKRAAGMGSTGKAFREDELFIKKMNSQQRQETTYAQVLKNKGVKVHKLSSLYGTELRTAVTEDVIVKSKYYEKIKGLIGEKDAKLYKEMSENNAQCLCTIDTYRNLRDAEGDWSKEQEALFQKVIHGETITPEEVVQFFPPYKCVYFDGVKAENDEGNLRAVAFHKYSIMPIIPSITEDRNIDLLNKKMYEEGIHYVTNYEGSKMANIRKNKKADEFYKHGVENRVISDEKFCVNVIQIRFLKDQLRLHDKFDDDVVYSTQFRKLVSGNIFENGEYIHEDLQKIHKRYTKNISSLTEVYKKELEKQFGITYSDGKYHADPKKVIEMVSSEFERREMSEDMIQSIARLKDASMSVNSDLIEQLLMTVVYKKVINQKNKGKSAVQVACTGFERPNAYKFGFSDDLEFYDWIDEEGLTMAMKCKITMSGDFEKLLHIEGIEVTTDGNFDFDKSLANLNLILADEEKINSIPYLRDAITMTSVRIPVQGLNSMDFMEVKEFLPPSYGQVVILPTEVVAKSGTDFDVDKSNIYMPHINLGKGKTIKMYNANDVDGRSKQEIEEEISIRYSALNGTLEKNEREAFEKIHGTIPSNFTNAKEKIDELEEKLKNFEKNALENAIISDAKEILSHHTMRKILLTPNSTSMFDEVASKLESTLSYDRKKMVNGDRTGRVSGTRFMDPIYNNFKHYANSVGKTNISIAAKANVISAQLRQSGAIVSPTFLGMSYEKLISTMLSSLSGTVEISERLQKAGILNFAIEHNTQIDKLTKEICISLSNRYDVDNKLISEIVSQIINGTVDVAKNPWLFSINANDTVLPVMLYMFQMGFGIGTTCHISTNPLVRTYVDSMIASKGIIGNMFKLGKTKYEARVQILTDMQKSGIIDSIIKNHTLIESEKSILESLSSGRFSNTKLFAAINVLAKVAASEGTITDKDLEDRVTEEANLSKDWKIWIQYVQAENLADEMLPITTSLSSDTHRYLSFAEYADKQKQLEEYKNGYLSGSIIDKMKKGSEISSFFLDEQVNTISDSIFSFNSQKDLSEAITSASNEISKNRQLKIEGSFTQSKSEIRGLIMADFKDYLLQASVIEKMLNRSSNGSLTYKGFTVKFDYKGHLRGGVLIDGDVIHVNKDFILQQPISGSENIDIARAIEKNLLRTKYTKENLKDSRVFQMYIKDVMKQHGKSESDELVAQEAYDKFIADTAGRNALDFQNMFGGGIQNYAVMFKNIGKSFPELSGIMVFFDTLSSTLVPGTANNYVLRIKSQLNSIALKNEMSQLEQLQDREFVSKYVQNKADVDFIIDFFSMFNRVAMYQNPYSFSRYSITPLVQSKFIEEYMTDEYINGVDIQSEFKAFFEKFKMSRGRGKQAISEYETVNFSNPLAKAAISYITVSDNNVTANQDAQLEYSTYARQSKFNISTESELNNNINTFGISIENISNSISDESTSEDIANVVDQTRSQVKNKVKDGVIITEDAIAAIKSIKNRSKKLKLMKYLHDNGLYDVFDDDIIFAKDFIELFKGDNKNLNCK